MKKMDNVASHWGNGVSVRGCRDLSVGEADLVYDHYIMYLFLDGTK